MWLGCIDMPIFTVDGQMLRQLLRGDDGVGQLLESVLNQVREAWVIEQDEKWATGRLCFRMDPYWEQRRSEKNENTFRPAFEVNSAS